MQPTDKVDDTKQAIKINDPQKLIALFYKLINLKACYDPPSVKEYEKGGLLCRVINV